MTHNFSFKWDLLTVSETLSIIITVGTMKAGKVAESYILICRQRETGPGVGIPSDTLPQIRPYLLILLK